MKRRYRRLEVGDKVEVVDIKAKGELYVSDYIQNGMVGTVLKEVSENEKSIYLHFTFADNSCPLDQWIPLECLKLPSFTPPRLIRKYRILKESEPIRMFDWFKLSVHHESGIWPAPDKQYNEGWCLITPDDNRYLADKNDPNDRIGFVFARFVDCVPVKKS